MHDYQKKTFKFKSPYGMTAHLSFDDMGEAIKTTEWAQKQYPEFADRKPAVVESKVGDQYLEFSKMLGIKSRKLAFGFFRDNAEYDFVLLRSTDLAKMVRNNQIFDDNNNVITVPEWTKKRRKAENDLKEKTFEKQKIVSIRMV